jgi:hypothetical protein
MFLKIIFYKLFRALKRFSRGGADEHFAFNALLFTLLLIFFNLVFFYFVAGEVFSFKLSNVSLKILSLIILAVLLTFSYYSVMIDNKWQLIIDQVNSSSYRGKKGTIFVFLYCLISLLMILGLVYYYLHPLLN